MEKTNKYHLKKVLGLSFGIAIMVGGVIGTGILRNPGEVAAMLQNEWLIILAWVCGGVYVLLAIGSLAELATMLPKAGGNFNYVKLAFGNYAGFVVGWFDYIINAIAVGYISIVLSDYIVLLFSSLRGNETMIAIGLVLIFTLFHVGGVKGGSITQQVTSFIKIFAFMALVICCFIFRENAPTAEINSTLGSTLSTGTMLVFIKALQLCIGTYGGWHAPACMAEEDTDPGKNLPRSFFFGAIIIMVVYVSINIALFYVLPVSAVAGSKLAIADVAKIIFGGAGFTIITLIAIFSLLSLLNAQLMISSRILYGLCREGFFMKIGILVNKGGTPYIALIFTSLIGIIMILIGSFEQLFSLDAFMTMSVNMLIFATLFKLRRAEPGLPRPYKAWGYPWIPIFMLSVSIALFISYAFADTKNFLVILAIIAITWPAFMFIKGKK